MRQPFVDYVKTLAITLVLLYHSGFAKWTPMMPLLSMCVPLFFISSGYLRAGKVYTLKKTSIQIIKIIFLILFWGTLSCIATCITKGEDYTINSTLHDVVGLRLGYCNHLWFLATFAILLSTHYFIQNLRKQQLLCALGITFVCTFDFTKRYIFLINPFGGWHSYALTYYLAGMLIPYLCMCVQPQSGKYLKFIRSNKCLFLLLLLLTFYICQFAINHITNTETFIARRLNVNVVRDTVFNAYHSFAVFAMTSIVFLLLRNCFSKRNSIIEFISNNVFTIYLLHGFALKFIKLHTGNSVAIFAFTYSVTLTVTYILSKIKISKYLLKI